MFNHNLETVPQLYRAARPGADYLHSLKLLQQFGHAHPDIPTKSGLMLGLGETPQQVMAVMQDLLDHGCRMLTLGQYLQPTRHHLPVRRYVPRRSSTCWATRPSGLVSGSSQRTLGAFLLPCGPAGGGNPGDNGQVRPNSLRKEVSLDYNLSRKENHHETRNQPY